MGNAFQTVAPGHGRFCYACLRLVHEEHFRLLLQYHELVKLGSLKLCL